MNILKTTAMFGLAIVASGTFAIAAELPKATEIYPKMGIGWNAGNTMEVPSDPTAWGNIVPNEAIIKGVKDAGFTTIRIPCAWYSHSDALTKDIEANGGSADNTNYTHVGKASDFTNPTIDATWLKQVKDVVDLAIAEGMYVILNSHWDEGWLEDRVYNGTESPRSGANNIANSSATTKARQAAFWKQIATYFKDYDEHLLFAGANEPGVNDPWGSNGQWEFTATRMEILKGYYDAFFSSVRNSGGNNATRTLIVQTPRTEIDQFQLLANNFPQDPAGEGYTMVEVHFYPYQLTIMNTGDVFETNYTMYEFYYWEDITTGNDANHTCTTAKSNDGSKQHIDNQFKKLQTTFADKGIPVVIGEMGANKRYSYKNNSGFNLDKHLDAIAAWYGYTVASAKTHGLVPVIWDTGFEGINENKDDMTLIRRQSSSGTDLGTVVDEKTLSAIMTQYDAAPAYTPAVKPVISENDKALWVTYTSASTSKQETGTVRISLEGADWSKYKAISFDIRTEGTYKPLTGDQYGWASFALFSMSGSDWSKAWAETKIGDVTSLNGTLNNVKVEFGSDDNQLNLIDKTNVNAIGINVYATQFNGTMYLNNILLHNTDGTIDTLQSFDSELPEFEGTAKVELIKANADGTGPSVTPSSSNSSTTPGSSNSGKNKDAIAAPAIAQNIHFSVEHGAIITTFNALTAGHTTITLMNSLGQVIASKDMNATRGTNSVSLETSYQGTAFLVIRQGSQMVVKAIRLK